MPFDDEHYGGGGDGSDPGPHEISFLMGKKISAGVVRGQHKIMNDLVDDDICKACFAFGIAVDIIARLAAIADDPKEYLKMCYSEISDLAGKECARREVEEEEFQKNIADFLEQIFGEDEDGESGPSQAG